MTVGIIAEKYGHQMGTLGNPVLLELCMIAAAPAAKGKYLVQVDTASAFLADAESYEVERVAFSI